MTRLTITHWPAWPSPIDTLDHHPLTRLTITHWPAWPSPIDPLDHHPLTHLTITHWPTWPSPIDPLDHHPLTRLTITHWPAWPSPIPASCLSIILVIDLWSLDRNISISKSAVKYNVRELSRLGFWCLFLYAILHRTWIFVYVLLNFIQKT